jgi:hypothetical protein|eukprot:31419-Pelagococcus_subviridis.AAC.10
MTAKDEINVASVDTPVLEAMRAMIEGRWATTRLVHVYPNDLYFISSHRVHPARFQFSTADV